MIPRVAAASSPDIACGAHCVRAPWLMRRNFSSFDGGLSGNAICNALVRYRGAGLAQPRLGLCFTPP